MMYVTACKNIKKSDVFSFLETFFLIFIIKGAVFSFLFRDSPFNVFSINYESGLILSLS